MSVVIAALFYGSQIFNRIIPILAALPLIFTTIVYSYGNFYPENRAANRQKDMDAYLSYALSYMSALSSAGVIPAEMFKTLARHKSVYGEISVEASKIYRDISLFGMDTVEALRNSAQNSPSLKYAEVMEGIIATMTSGMSLKDYLLTKSEQYREENRRMQRGAMETLGIFAESYMVVGVAFPLFLLIILSVMLFVTTSTMGMSVLFLYVLVFLILPVLSIVFAYLMKDIVREA